MRFEREQNHGASGGLCPIFHTEQVDGFCPHCQAMWDYHDHINRSVVGTRMLRQRLRLSTNTSSLFGTSSRRGDSARLC